MKTHDRERDAEELQKSVEQTRQQLGKTLSAIQARLQPQRVFEQVRGSVRDGVREAAGGATDQLAGAARVKAEDTVAALMETIRTSPLAKSLVAMGLGWALNAGAARARGQAEATVRHAGESLQQAASEAQERVQARAGELGDAAREQLQQVEAWLQRATGTAPLALGALALAAGVILGFTLPATPQERELLGEVRESLLRQARELSQDAGDRAERLAHEARDAAGRAARDQGLIH